MRTLLILAAFAVLILLGASCHTDEKTCPPQTTTDVNLQARLDSLNQREAALNAREQAIAARESALQPVNGSGASTADMSTASSKSATGGDMTSHNGAHSRKAAEEPAVAHKKSMSGTPGEYPEGSERLLADKDVQYLTPWGAKVMLNEIYARHGMTFTEPDLRKHFRGQSWYKGSKGNVDKMLTSMERQNIAFIHEHMNAEKK